MPPPLFLEGGGGDSLTSGHTLTDPPIYADAASFGKKVIEHQLLECLVGVAKKHPTCAGIQTSVLNIVDRTFSLPDHCLGNVETAPEVWLEVVRAVFQDHTDSPKVQGAACQCLARLLEVFPDLQCTISDKEEE